MPLSRLLSPSLCIALVVAFTGNASAVQPAELLLPATTKGFISTQDVDEVRKQFNETQFGQMAHDPAMEPFIEDLKKQIGAKLERAGKKLGLKWDDMEGVYAGESAIALIQPDPKDKMSHATALIIDITGKRKEADELLKKVAANQKGNKATVIKVKDTGVEITIYKQPLKEGEKFAEVACNCIAGDQLIFSDHEATIRGIVHRADGKAKDSLASVVAFNESLKHCAEHSNGVRHNVRWFIEPFGYVEASRAAQGGRKKRGTDILKILQTQGFTAVQGVGGHIFFATDDGGTIVEDRPEILHRTFVYAPAVQRAANDKSKDKYNLAMRMLDFPNSPTTDALEPQPWTLPDVASYLSFNWKMKEAFEHASTLVDALIGDKGAFEEIWISLKSDVNGPQIDIRKELLNHLSTRGTLFSDVRLPVDTKSERLMALVEISDQAVVAKTVEKAFKNDPQAKKRVFKGQVIWEITQDETLADEPGLTIEGAGFVNAEIPGTAASGAGNSAPEAEAPPMAGQKSKAKVVEEEADTRLPNMAVTVYQNHLIVATHVDYIQDFISLQSNANSLAQQPDYQRVRAALITLGSKNDSFHFFTRTDESYRATYELFRQGKLPEAETMLARVLNSLLGPQEEGVLRQQELDGSKLPEFELVKKYMGPGGVFAQTEEDGWWVVGCLLRKQ